MTPGTVCSLRVDGAKSHKSRPLNFNVQVTFARCACPSAISDSKLLVITSLLSVS